MYRASLLTALLLLSACGVEYRLGEPDLTVSSPADAVDRFEVVTGYAYAIGALPLDSAFGSWEVMCVPADLDAPTQDEHDCAAYLEQGEPLVVVRFSDFR